MEEEGEKIMFILYTKYESSILATIISFIASVLLLIGLGTIILDNETIVKVLGGVSLIIGIMLKFLAKSIARDEHIRKLTEDVDYSKKVIKEHPEVQEYCIENNPDYAEEYEEKIGKGNFDPNDYKPN